MAGRNAVRRIVEHRVNPRDRVSTRPGRRRTVGSLCRSGPRRRRVGRPRGPASGKDSRATRRRRSGSGPCEAVHRRARESRDPSAGGREAPEALVGSKYLPMLVLDEALVGLEAVAREKRAIVVTAEKAGFLALRSAGCRKPGALCFRPCLLLGLLSEWERDSVEDARIEPREHVRLILVGVRGARQEQPSAVLDDARVVPVARRAAPRCGRTEKSSEPEEPVATDAGFGVSPRGSAHEGSTIVCRNSSRASIVTWGPRAGGTSRGRRSRPGQSSRRARRRSPGSIPAAGHPDRLWAGAEQRHGAVHAAAHRDRARSGRAEPGRSARSQRQARRP